MNMPLGWSALIVSSNEQNHCHAPTLVSFADARSIVRCERWPHVAFVSETRSRLRRPILYSCEVLPQMIFSCVDLCLRQSTRRSWKPWTTSTFAIR